MLKESNKNFTTVLTAINNIWILILVVVVPLFYISYTTISEDKEKVFLYSGIIILILNIFFCKQTKFKFSKLDIPILVFLITSTITFTMSENKKEAFIGYYGWKMGFLMTTICIGMYFVISKTNIKIKLDYIIPAVLGAVSIIAIIDHTVINGDVWVGTIGQCNWYAAFLSIFLTYTFLQIFHKNNFALICFIPGVISAFVCQADSAYLILGVCGLIAIYKIYKSNLKYNRLITVFFLFTSITVLAFIGKEYFIFDDSWGSNRGLIYKECLNAYINLPIKEKLFGVGQDCLYTVVDLYSVFGATVTVAHNEWLNLLITNGIVGMLSWLAVILTAIYQCIKNKNELIFVILSYLVFNLVGFQCILNYPYFYLILAKLKLYF